MNQHRKNSFWFALVLLIGLAACQALSPQPTANPTATLQQPTLEPSPTIDWFPRTPTPVSIPTSNPEEVQTATPMLVEEDYLVRDDFSDHSLWQTGTSEAGTIAYEASGLSLALLAGKHSLSSLSQHQLPSDFYLEITIDILMCSPEDQYGLILWNNSSSGTYRVWFDSSGQTKLDRVLPSGTSLLENWQTGRKIQPGSPAQNRIGILSKEGVLEIYVNDELQFSHSPVRKLEGAFGVIAQSNSSHAMTVRVSDLKITAP